MLHTKKLLLVIVLMAAFWHLGARSVTDVIPGLTEGQVEQLRQGEVISNDSSEEDRLMYVPEETIMERTIAQTTIDENTLFTECLTLIPYPDYFSNLSHDEQQLHVFNTLRSVSTQEGITYISYRKGNKPALLIEDSHVTDRIGGRKELEDPVVDTLPRQDRLIIYQRDTSFRKNYYEYQYRTSGEEIFQQVTNKTDMRVWGLIPAVRKDAMDINTSVLFTDEGMLAYSLAVAPNQKSVIKILTIRVHLPSAFQRRMVAVQEWFVDQLQTNRPAE
ncbi:MAG: DUF6675 family protein [Spirochaetota bacterium]